MCDPVTMSATSAAMSSFGTYLAGSSTSAIASFGTGMVNTATLFNYGSSYGKLGGSLSAGAAGIGSTIGSGAVALASNMDLVGAGLNIFSNITETSAALRSQRIEEQRQRAIQKRAEEKAQEIRLETLKKSNQRTRAYIENLAAMEASVSGTAGIEFSSASYEALVRRSRKNYKSDIADIRAMGLTQVVNNMFTAQDASFAAMSSKATRPSILAKGLFNTVKTGLDYSKELKQFDASDVGINTFSKRGVN